MEDYLPEHLVLASRREENAWVHSDGVYKIVPMQECQDAGSDLCGLRNLWNPVHKKIRSRLCAREYKTKKQGQIQRALLASLLFSAVLALEDVKALVSIMMSVGWSSRGEPLKLRHYDISRVHVQ